VKKHPGLKNNEQEGRTGEPSIWTKQKLTSWRTATAATINAFGSWICNVICYRRGMESDTRVWSHSGSNQIQRNQICPYSPLIPPLLEQYHITGPCDTLPCCTTMLPCDVTRLMRGPQPKANGPSEPQRRALAGLNRFQRLLGGRGVDTLAAAAIQRRLE
jgi:hypothetical protein